MEVLIELDLKEIGFEPIGHFTVMNSYNYDLGRSRFLSLGSFGTPNEMLFILQRNTENPKTVDDAVCIHNYDYDGYLTKEKLQNIVTALTPEKKEKAPLYTIEIASYECAECGTKHNPTPKPQHCKKCSNSFVGLI